MSDQAVWFGMHVWAWKRWITAAQLVSGSSIFLNLMNAERKMRLHATLTSLRERSEKITVPPVVSSKTIYKILVPIMATFATLTQIPYIIKGERISWIIAGFLAWAFILFAVTIWLTIFIKTISLALTTVRFFERHTPRLLAWAFHYERFDGFAAVAFFLLLAIATIFQIVLS